MRKSFRRDYSSLDAIFEFVSTCLESCNVDRSHSPEVGLIIEEIFTNMVKYNGPGDPEITVSLEKVGGKLVICLTDVDVDRFDITEVPQVDITQPIHERRPGGLGLHLVRKMAEKVSYEYADRTSKITITKSLESRHV